MSILNCSVSRSVRVLGAVVATSLLASSAASQQLQPLPISSTLNSELGMTNADPRPEPDWGRSLRVASSSMNILMPNDDPNDPKRTAALDSLAKELFREVVADEYGNVVAPSGQLRAWLESGTIYGVEFDVLANDTTAKPAPGTGCLDVVGQITYDDGSGPVLQGRMYCLTKSQYTARETALQVTRSTVWLGATLHARYTGARSIYVLGTGNTFRGDVRSSGSVRIAGTNLGFEGGLCYAGLVELSGSGNTFDKVVKEAARPLRDAPRTDLDYEQLAAANLLSFSGDVTIAQDAQGVLATTSGEPVDGKVVYATGTITVEGVGLSGRVTLVAGQSVEFSCSSSVLTAAADDLLALSASSTASEGILLDGSGNLLTGSLHVRDTSFRLTGSENVYTGQVSAKKIKVSGEANTIGDGTR